MQDTWTARKAEEIQGYTNRNEWKSLFAEIKAVYGPTANGSASLLSAVGTTLFTEKVPVLKRWAEQFRSILSHLSTISYALSIDRLKWRRKPTLTSSSPSTKLSGPCSKSPARRRPDQT
ncbi:hypothetical protein SprV_0301140200 [Sparganum proliferum]